MISTYNENTSAVILNKSKALGASAAGITPADALRRSPSYEIYGDDQRLFENRAVLILALSHRRSEPSLDWWDGKKGTPGNSRLIEITELLIHELFKMFKIRAHHLPYHVEKGGIFLKDAAVLAGFGIIGKNNLLITPDFGPRVRLRALLVDAPLKASPPFGFNPCKNCDKPCMRACPQKAFGQGVFTRPLCNRQMKKNERNAAVVEGKAETDAFIRIIKYCRACELACPVGK